MLVIMTITMIVMMIAIITPSKAYNIAFNVTTNKFLIVALLLTYHGASAVHTALLSIELKFDGGVGF